jgi:hypothetical protein
MCCCESENVLSFCVFFINFSNERVLLAALHGCFLNPVKFCFGDAKVSENYENYLFRFDFGFIGARRNS